MTQSQSGSFEGRVVFISGGTSGINLGIAQQFAVRGARVLVFGRRRDQADAAARSIREHGGQHAMAGAADVRDYQAVAALFLSSDAASFVTGAIFDCDGGMTLGDASGNYLKQT